MSLGTLNGAIGALDLFGSSSGTAALTGGTNGTFTSASPWALSGVVTLSGASNAFGTPLTLVGTNISGTAANLTAGTATAANALNSATTTVVVSAATAPTSGQVLTATSGTAANWQTPSAGGSITFTDGVHTVTGSTQLTVTGGTVGGTTPNATLTVSGASGANPTATAGPSAVNGSATTFMRSDAAPAVQKAAASTFGIMEPDGQTLLCPSGVCTTTAPTRTAASPTVATTDMGGTIYVSSGGITIPAITTGLFDAKQTLQLVNYSGSTEAITTSITINAGGNCVTATGIPAGYAWLLQSNNTTLDCTQVVSSASGSGTVTTASVVSANGFAGTVANATTTPAITLTTSVTGVLKGNGTAISAATAGTDYVAPGAALGTPSSGTLTNTTGLPISTGLSGLTANDIYKATSSTALAPSSITDNGTNVAIAEGALTTPFALTAGATISVNAASSNVQTVTLGANSTLANPTNLIAGQIIQFNITQPASGGPYTLAFGTDYQNFSGAAFTVTLNTAASAVTVFQCTTITTSVLQCGQAVNTTNSATSQKQVSAPTAPASTTTYFMQGLAGSITPATTGTVLITISGTVDSGAGTAAGNGIIYQLSYGTGTAPSNAAALTGTQVGTVQQYTNSATVTAFGDVNVPFSTQAVVTGLTVGTTYWVDLAAKSIATASDISLENISVSVVEIH